MWKSSICMWLERRKKESVISGYTIIQNLHTLRIDSSKFNRDQHSMFWNRPWLLYVKPLCFKGFFNAFITQPQKNNFQTREILYHPITSAVNFTTPHFRFDITWNNFSTKFIINHLQVCLSLLHAMISIGMVRGWFLAHKCPLCPLTAAAIPPQRKPSYDWAECTRG